MPPSSPRTLVFSQRRVDRQVYQCWKYEFEDVIQEIDSVDLLAPPPLERSRLGRLAARSVNRARRSLGLYPIPGVDRVTVSRDYELFFAAFLFPAEAIHLEHIVGWRERAHRAACFLGEVWTKDESALRRLAPLLRKFDHIFLHVGASLPMVEAVLDRPCHLIHVAIDASRFCPLPLGPERTVDCYSLGRRVDRVHGDLLALAAREKFFYIYDTVRNFSVIDPLEHRRLVAEIAKRARYFIAFRHNVNAANQTGGDEAFGNRHFEGMAAGAVLLGAAPKCLEFATTFDWPDAVIEIPPDENIAAVIKELERDPARLATARRNNVVGILRRHDWAHRWSSILKAVGLEPLPALHGRLERLEKLVLLTEQHVLLPSPSA